MKLIWLSAECPYPPNTGGRMVTWKRIEKLSQRHDIFLFSIVDSERDFDYIDNLKKCCKEVYLYQRKRSLRVMVQSLFKPFPAVSRWNTGLSKKLEEKCEQIDPDYIVVDFPQMLGNLSTDIICRWKVVLNQHNIEHLTLKSIAKTQSSFLKKLSFKFVSNQMRNYERKIYSRGRIYLYTFVSEKDKFYFEDEYSKKNTYLFPIGCEIKNNVIHAQGHTVAYIANFSYKPNEEGAIWFLKNVWEKVLDKVPDAVFSLVGRAPSDTLIKQAQETGNIVVTGEVDSVDEYYAKNNVIVVPLFSGGGAKVKLIEALGYGNSVVSTTEGIRGTNFSNRNELMVADDAELFASICIDMLKNPESYESMRAQAKQSSLQYSWDKIVNDFEVFLNDQRSRECSELKITE